MCTHAAECFLAESQPAVGSGSSPSPLWALSPALSPPAVRLGPFPSSLTEDQTGRTEAVVEGTDSSPGLTSSSESYSPA